MIGVTILTRVEADAPTGSRTRRSVARAFAAVTLYTYFMRCETCDYPLFDIRERTCPECGTPFRPSQFEFSHCGVRFCCLHCDQQYYGTGHRGHLVPKAFRCIRCNNDVNMNEMVVRVPLHKVLERQRTSGGNVVIGLLLILLTTVGLIFSMNVVTRPGAQIMSLRDIADPDGAAIALAWVHIVTYPLVAVGAFLLIARRSLSLWFLAAWTVLRLVAVALALLIVIGWLPMSPGPTTPALLGDLAEMLFSSAPLPAVVGFILHFKGVRHAILAWNKPPTQQTCE